MRFEVNFRKRLIGSPRTCYELTVLDIEIRRVRFSISRSISYCEYLGFGRRMYCLLLSRSGIQRHTCMPSQRSRPLVPVSIALFPNILKTSPRLPGIDHGILPLHLVQEAQIRPNPSALLDDMQDIAVGHTVVEYRISETLAKKSVSPADRSSSLFLACTNTSIFLSSTH